MPRPRSRRQATSPVAISGELFAPVSPGIELCYQTFGEPDADPLLLVMGLGGPMTWWPDDLCSQLAAAGFYVIRYDNRDTGRSTRVQHRVTRPMIVQAFLGRRSSAPYTLLDMAADGFGLLDHLGIASAHVTGVSMGGMIAQEMAVAHPERVRSLVSIMSTTGRRTVGWQDPRILPAMLAAKGSELEEYVAAAARMGALIGSPGYPEPAEEARARAEVTHRRGLSGSGVLRQMLAVLAQKDRAPRLRELNVPAAVIHGMDDRMVHPSGGRATAQALRGANLLLIPGMGHDLPTALFATYVEVIRTTADRARTVA